MNTLTWIAIVLPLVGSGCGNHHGMNEIRIGAIDPCARPTFDVRFEKFLPSGGIEEITISESNGIVAVKVGNQLKVLHSKSEYASLKRKILDSSIWKNNARFDFLIGATGCPSEILYIRQEFYGMRLHGVEIPNHWKRSISDLAQHALQEG